MDLLTNLDNVLQTIEDSTPLCVMYTKYDNGDINIRMYDEKSGDLLIDRFDTLLNTLKFCQGFVRCLNMYKQGDLWKDTRTLT